MKIIVLVVWMERPFPCFVVLSLFFPIPSDSKQYKSNRLILVLTNLLNEQSVSVASVADDGLLGVQELTVLVPLHVAPGRGVDDAHHLHLVPVPAVDEGLLLLYLRLVQHIKMDLERV